EDGIRDRNVTGVQTCALPISTLKAVQILQTPFANNAVAFSPDGKRIAAAILNPEVQAVLWDDSGKELRQLSGHTDWSSCAAFSRSEERRVGKEGSSRWSLTRW